ncbi:hypothetical protein J6590_044750, partial [Homalodisca vitripennis]
GFYTRIDVDSTSICNEDKCGGPYCSTNSPYDTQHWPKWNNEDILPRLVDKPACRTGRLVHLQCSRAGIAIVSFRVSQLKLDTKVASEASLRILLDISVQHPPPPQTATLERSISYQSYLAVNVG